MKDLIQLRGEINEIDLEILNLLEKRAVVSKGVANYKQEQNLEIFQPQRENELLNQRTSNLPEELQNYKGEIKIILQSIMDFSKEVHKNELEVL
jgi:monofunctional chorismate mutase